MYAAIPVYYPSLEEAARKDEAALWCDSYNINMDCRNFIQAKAMTVMNSRELDSFIGELVRFYGVERAIYVLSRTVQFSDWDSRVRIFRSAAVSEGLTEQEADSFLRLLNSSKAKTLKIDPHGLSLKMLRISCPFMEDGTLRPFSIRWPHSATISSTDFSIQRISAPLKTESGSTLSLADILEPEVDQKYFLSQRAVEKLLSNS